MPKLTKPVKKLTKTKRKKDRPLTQPDYVETPVYEEVEADYPELDKIFKRMAAIKEQGKVYMDLEVQAVALYKEYGLKSYNGRTLVEGDTTTIDYDRVMAALTPAQRKLVVVERIDPVKLEGAVKTGLIPAALVIKHMASKPKKPYFTGIK